MNPIPPVARAIWEAKGRPEGQDSQNWREAEEAVMAWAMRQLVEAMCSAGPPFPAPSLGEMRRQPDQTARMLATAAMGGDWRRDADCPEAW